jgi:hypothetical protein
VKSEETGQPVTVMSALAGFGGVEKLMESKKRLGVEVA